MGLNEAALQRQAVVKQLLQRRTDELVITGLGNPSWDLFNTHTDRDDNFYLWGAMGGATAVALGLALAQPSRRVIVITGDGDLLMGLGNLATIAVQAPRNLSVVVLDNEHYAETGGQTTHTHAGVDLAGVAGSCGFSNSLCVRNSTELTHAIECIFGENGPNFVAVKVGRETHRGQLPPRHGPYLKERFRRALLEGEHQ